MLSSRQRAALDALLPSDAHPVLTRGLFDAGFDEFHASFEREAHPSLRWTFRAALWCAVWVSPLLIGALPPVSRLGRDDRERALGALVSHPWYPLRQMGFVLKAVAAFCYGADRASRRAVGYPRQHDEAE